MSWSAVGEEAEKERNNDIVWVRLESVRIVTPMAAFIKKRHAFCAIFSSASVSRSCLRLVFAPRSPHSADALEHKTKKRKQKLVTNEWPLNMPTFERNKSLSWFFGYCRFACLRAVMKNVIKAEIFERENIWRRRTKIANKNILPDEKNKKYRIKVLFLQRR